jgi:HlyD family secretion protein
MSWPIRRWIGVGLTVAVAAAAAGAAWTGSRQDAAPDGLAWGNGRLEATEVQIATKRPGRVREILVDEGDTVAAGQVVAHMDTQDLEADLRAAQAMSNEARQTLAHAIATVAERESVLALAEKSYQRSLQLSRQGHIADQTLDEDRSRRETAEAGLRAARTMVEQAQAAIAASAAREERIKVDLADATLTAPVGGRVLYRLVEPGEILPAGGRIVSVLDLTDVYVTIFLPARDATRVAIGAEARIVLDAEPDAPLAARLSFVAPAAQFTPKEVETRSEREKLTFRAKVSVAAEALDGRVAAIKTGLPAMAYVRIDPDAAWPPLEASNAGDG